MGSDWLTYPVQQCLFGYDDGHRLLESSMAIQSRVLAQLLALSDLASGVTLADGDSYWTGLSVPALEAYVLMKTWNAPEMPRPGSVWTHALIVSLEDIGAVNDLRSLAGLARRPSVDAGFAEYSVPIEPATRRSIEGGQAMGVLIIDGHTQQLIRSIYSANGKGVVIAPQGHLDHAVFAVWTQQWSSLRKSFTFRTSASISQSRLAGVEFNSRIVWRNRATPDKANDSLQHDDQQNEWESIVLSDLNARNPTQFRRFIWRYGEDTSSGHSGFNKLSELFVMLSRVQSSRIEQMDVLIALAKLFPEVSDALLLKTELTSPTPLQPPLLIPVDATISLQFFITQPRFARAFPDAKRSILDHLDASWPHEADGYLKVASLAVDTDSPSAGEIVGRVAALVTPDDVFLLPEISTRLRRALVSARPALIDSTRITTIEPASIVELLQLLPRSVAVSDGTIRSLLSANIRRVVEAAYDRFPDQVEQIYLDTFDGRQTLRISSLPSTLDELMKQNARRLLTNGNLNRLISTRALATVAIHLGLDNPEVIDAGPLPWAAALVGAQEDVSGSMGRAFDAFLLAVALAHPVEGSEILIERAFESTHNAIASGVLEPDLFALLEPFLPQLRPEEQWDSCKRLRRAVTRTYLDNGLNMNSLEEVGLSRTISIDRRDKGTSTDLARKLAKKIRKLR